MPIRVTCANRLKCAVHFEVPSPPTICMYSTYPRQFLVHYVLPMSKLISLHPQYSTRSLLVREPDQSPRAPIKMATAWC